jgi:hypothetical protein
MSFYHCAEHCRSTDNAIFPWTRLGGGGTQGVPAHQADCRDGFLDQSAREFLCSTSALLAMGLVNRSPEYQNVVCLQ